MIFFKKISRLPWIFAFLSVFSVNLAAETATLSIGAFRISAEVAKTPNARARGLMHRKSLAQNRGMLFIFDSKNTHCMWMKNTHIPLAVAFLDDSGFIINIEKMQPRTTISHCAKRPARYALEANIDFFDSKKITKGMRVRGLTKIAKPAQ